MSSIVNPNTSTPDAAPLPPAPPPAVSPSPRPAAYSPLRAVILKEVWEQLKFVVAILVIIALTFSLYMWGNFYDGEYAAARPIHDINALFHPGFYIVASIFCIVSGLFLGLGQILSERVFDVRSFFRHRAISPTRLFVAKISAGMILYFLAIGVPLLIFIAWCANSPKAGPIFSLYFARPYLVIYFSGIAYYLAALIATQRQARWYVSKVFSIPTAIFASLCTYLISDYHTALLSVLLLVALLALTAWNTYVHAGVDTPLGQPPIPAPKLQHHIAPLDRLRRFSLPLVMVISLSLIACLLLAVNTVILSHLQTVRELEENSRPISSAERYAVKYSSTYEVLPDGIPARRDVEYHPHVPQKDEVLDPNAPLTPDQFIKKWSDLAGNPIPESVINDFNQAKTWDVEIYRTATGDTSYFDETSVMPIVSAYGYNDTSLPPKTWEIRWYYLKPWHLFAGYDLATRTRVGTVGPSGFSRGMADPFPRNAVWDYYQHVLVDKNKIYYMYTEKDNVKLQLLAPVPAEETIQQIIKFNHVRSNPQGSNETSSSSSPWINTIIMTDKQLYFYQDITQPQVFSIPNVYPLKNHILSFIQNPQTHRLTAEYTLISPFPETNTQYTTFNERGERIYQAQVPPLIIKNIKTYNPAPLSNQALHFSALGAVDAFRNPLLISFFPWHNIGVSTDDDFGTREQLNRIGPVNLPRLFYLFYPLSQMAIHYYAGLGLILLLAAATTCWLTIRYQFTRAGQILWTLATLLCGPVILLTFLFTQPLPARIVCPGCHKKRLASQRHCHHCRSLFPQPTQTGTEMFDSTPAT